MKKEVFINLEKEIFKGNLLDVGFSNYGIIYNIYKQYSEEGNNIEYIEGKEEKIEKGIYDSCVLFFSLSNILFRFNKVKLIQEIYEFLKEDGLLYIWDMDKGYARTFNSKIKVLLPDKSSKEITLRDLNLFKNNSKENTIKILQPYFEILTLKNSDNIYYMICKRRGRTADESNTSSN